MSKKELDQFLGKKTESPLDTDKIYGGNSSKFDVITTKKVRTVEEVITVTD